MKQELDTKLRAILACLIWGSAFAGAKIAFEYMQPVFLSALRFILAGVILAPLIIYKKIDIKPAIKHWKFVLLFSFVQTFLQYGLFYAGLDNVPGALSSIIMGGGPLFIALLAHYTLGNDKMDMRKMGSIILGVAGIIFISLAGGAISIDSNEFYIGVLFLVLSNIVGSYTNIMVVKRRDIEMSPYVLTAFANFIGGVGLLALSFIVEEPTMSELPFEFYLALLWLALIPAISFSIWYGLLQRPGVKVSELNMWKFIIPVTGCILSWLFLPGESPNWVSIVGILIIVAALQLQQKKR